MKHTAWSKLKQFALGACLLIHPCMGFSAESVDGLDVEMRKRLYQPETFLAAKLDLRNLNHEMTCQTVKGMFDKDLWPTLSSWFYFVEQYPEPFEPLAQYLVKSGHTQALVVGIQDETPNYYTTLPLAGEMDETAFQQFLSHIQPLIPMPIEIKQIANYAVALEKGTQPLKDQNHSQQVEDLLLAALSQAKPGTTLSLAMLLDRASKAMPTESLEQEKKDQPILACLRSASFVAFHVTLGPEPELSFSARFENEPDLIVLKTLIDNSVQEFVASAQDLSGIPLAKNKLQAVASHHKKLAQQVVTALNMQIAGNTFTLSLDTAQIRQISRASLDLMGMIPPSISS